MDRIMLLAMVVLVVAFLLVKRASLISEATARKYLANGALIIDVRSPEEFGSGNLPGAINIPLGELKAAVPNQVKDKHQVLLLHCLGGGRSGIAQHQLKGLGYANVFNLGSLKRARRIVQASS